MRQRERDIDLIDIEQEVSDARRAKIEQLFWGLVVQIWLSIILTAVSPGSLSEKPWVIFVRRTAVATYGAYNCLASRGCCRMSAAY